MDAQHHRTEDDRRHQAGGDGQETLAQTDKVDLLLLGRSFAGSIRTVEAGVPQSLDRGSAPDHGTGGKDAKHEVEQHASEQRVAEGVDGACGRGAEGKEDEVQGLGKEAVRGAECTHQDDRDDDDGHVAVDNGGQAAGKAALERAVEALAAAQLLLDALGGDDVGIHAHADGEDDAGDAGQGQGEALKHREVAGDEGQRGRHLTGQRDAGEEAGQTVEGRHEHEDEGKGDDTGQHHGAQAVLAQTRADGGVAVHAQRKGQRAGVDLAGHFDDIFLREGIRRRAGDDGRAVGDGGVDAGGADVLVVQPDADAAAVLVQTGGGVAECLGTLVSKLQRHIVLGAAAVDGAVLGSSTLHHRAVKDQRTVCAAPLPEGQVGGGADLLNGGFGVELGLARLPRELEDEAVGVVVHIQLIVGHVEGDQTVLDDQLSSLKLVVGGVVAVGGDEGDVDAALDVHTEADVLCSLDVGGGHITVLDRNTEERRIDERRDHKHREDKLPCFAFRFHMNRETSKYNMKLLSGLGNNFKISAAPSERQHSGDLCSGKISPFPSAVSRLLPDGRRHRAGRMRSPPHPDWDKWARCAGGNHPGPCGRGMQSLRQ